MRRSRITGELDVHAGSARGHGRGPVGKESQPSNTLRAARGEDRTVPTGRVVRPYTIYFSTFKGS
eukprot:scaffold216523_cov28-Tisochrysis_lutea.AAC.2